MVPLHIDGDDARFGNLRGEPEIINFVLEEYISKHGLDSFVGRNNSNRCDPVLITLFGRFQYQDDPTPPVLLWMQKRCNEWKVQAKHKVENNIISETVNGTNGETSVASVTVAGNEAGRNLVIALHIRVPEVFVSHEWEEANRLSHAVVTLEKVWEELKVQAKAFDNQAQKRTTIQLDVFTEESFTRVMEIELMEFLSKSGILQDDDGTKLRIHRQTPLLPCVQSMAVADIFIPASSYLSSMAAFFNTVMIVVPNECTRRERYFATHLKYQMQKSQTIKKDSNKNVSFCDGHKSSLYSCPIVRVEKDEELKAAIKHVWESNRS